jgi:hypothetical protein
LLYSLGADPTENIVFIVTAQKYLDRCLLIRCRGNLFTESFVYSYDLSHESIYKPYKQLNQHFNKSQYLDLLVEFRQENSGYGRFWGHLRLGEDARRVAAGVLRSLKKLS